MNNKNDINISECQYNINIYNIYTIQTITNNSKKYDLKNY